MSKTKTGYDKYNKNFSSLHNVDNNISYARVKNIILDNKSNPELFKKYGEWNSIGLILYDDIQNPLPNDDPRYIENHAYPLFPNIKQYPLINEIVYLIKLPSPGIQSNTNNLTTYYFPPLNNWNSIHHNAIPNNVYGTTLPDSQDKNFTQISEGNARKNSEYKIYLGDTFNEKNNVYSLLPYEGDIIYEGRWGNSIRFGSTVNNPLIPNLWSSSGNNGDPIIIISNGQSNDNRDPWVPIIEDINKEKSSIYITSTQKIPIKPSSDNYSSYKNKPISPKEYNKEQIILNSGRLFFNSKNDSILLSSANSINLNSINTVNIDSKETTIRSDKVLIGSNSSSEPILLGNKTIQSLNNIFQSLQKLIIALQPVQSLLPEATAQINLNVAAAELSTILQSELNKYGASSPLKSKKIFTE